MANIYIFVCHMLSWWMGMQDEHSILQRLEEDDVNVLLQLYYQQERIVDDIEETESLRRLLDRQLVSTLVPDGVNVILTEQGLAICDSIFQSRMERQIETFRERISVLPSRAVACIVNRLLWRKKMFPEFEQYYESAQVEAWFEGVLLSVPEIQQVIGGLYMVLDSLGLAAKVENEWCCPSGVEVFLRDEYQDVMDLSWAEEDSLKYYYFFYGYARDQRHLIDFSQCNDRYRSMFFGNSSFPSEWWFSSNRLNPHSLLVQLDLSKNRVVSFLRRMQRLGVIEERYYPLSTFSVFTDGDTMFVIKDIGDYMRFITETFLKPVAEALLQPDKAIKSIF